VIHGWATGLLGVVYKAHLFVANAFLLLMYPVFFLRRITRVHRIWIGGLFVCVFFSVIWISQSTPQVPTIRLDGTGAEKYMGRVLSSYDGGRIKSLLTSVLETEHLPSGVRPLVWASMLGASTFGLWSLACLVSTVLNRRRLPLAVLLFPWVVILNYLVMSLGLALDRNGVGNVDELLNRPLVWAYFAVVSWTAGSLCGGTLGERLAKSARTRVLLSVLLLPTLYVPLTLGRNLQTLPTWGFWDFEGFNSVPTCLVDAGKYIRTHSTPEEIIQNSEGDSKLVLSALAERREFAVDYYIKAQAPAGLTQRLDDLKLFRGLRDEKDDLEFARARGITWYVVHPSTTVAWADVLAKNVVFSCDAFRVYRFDVE
jgi:hypothetical protein